MTLKEQEDAIFRFSTLEKEIMKKSQKETEQTIDKKVFTSEALQKAFAAMDQRRQPTEVIKLSGALLFEIAGGPVRCRVCDDDCLVESLYDRGPGLAPCFESCPNLDEPWHVKR